MSKERKNDYRSTLTITGSTKNTIKSSEEPLLREAWRSTLSGAKIENKYDGISNNDIPKIFQELGKARRSQPNPDRDEKYTEEEIENAIMKSGVSVSSNKQIEGNKYNNPNKQESEEIIQNKYKNIPNNEGGNCAVYAIQHALKIVGCDLGTDFNLIRQSICSATQKFLQFDLLMNTEDPSWVINCYQNIFGNGNLSAFQGVVSKYIEKSLNASGNTEETQKSLVDLSRDITAAQDWNELVHKAGQIYRLCNTFDINVNTILEDHQLNLSTPPTDYYDHASKSGVWLNNSEISAYLLTLGFILNSENPIANGTYIEYINQAGQKIYFYNNGIDGRGNNSSGTHWMAATLSMDNGNSSEPNKDKFVLHNLNLSAETGYPDGKRKLGIPEYSPSGACLEVDDLNISNLSIEDNSRKPSFVINCIMRAKGEESSDSSDEGYDEGWGKDLEEFDPNKFDSNDKYKFPYRTFRIEKEKTKNGKDKIIKFNGFVSEKVKLLSNSEKNIIQAEETSVGDFLKKLYDEGLEGKDQENIKDTLAASICLNRPLSLSTRKNNLLKKEFKASSENALITHDKFALYWSIPWHDSKDKPVDYTKVNHFYKKLKRFDKEHNTKKAKKFREACEDGISVPYQELRELAKNHPHTAKLAELLRTKSSDVYLSIVDGDTISFNGIYSAYTKIYNQSTTSPTIMSTGYVFQKDNAEDRPFVKCAKLDRLIRIETAKYFPLGTYYPEPNLCILIEPNLNSVTESFIDKTRGKGISLEAPILVSNILKSRGPDIVCIFSKEDPLVTTIPDRFRLTKNRTAQLKFSKEFIANGVISAEDFRKFDQIGQSKTNGREYAKALYYNRWFTLKGQGITGNFNGIVDNLFKCNKDNENTYIKKLKEIIPSKKISPIIQAILASKSLKLDYKKAHVLSDDFRKYIKEELKCQITDYNLKFINIISNAEITDLFRKEILDLDKLHEFFLEISKLSDTVFQKIMCNSEIVAMLENNWITTDDIMKFCNTVVRHEEDLSDSIDQLTTAINNGIYDTDDIIESYNQNKLHLLFMASEDHNDLVLDYSEDEKIVKFALEYYHDELDLEWIKDQLSESAQMDFKVLIGEYEDDNWENDESIEEEGCPSEWLTKFPDSDDETLNPALASTEYDIINDYRIYTVLTGLINRWKAVHTNSLLSDLLDEGAEIIRQLSYEEDSKIITDLHNKKAEILKQIGDSLVVQAQDDRLEEIVNMIEGYTFVSQADNTPTYNIVWDTINEELSNDSYYI